MSLEFPTVPCLSSGRYRNDNRPSLKANWREKLVQLIIPEPLGPPEEWTKESHWALESAPICLIYNMMRNNSEAMGMMWTLLQRGLTKWLTCSGPVRLWTDHTEVLGTAHRLLNKSTWAMPLSMKPYPHTQTRPFFFSRQGINSMPESENPESGLCQLYQFC